MKKIFFSQIAVALILAIFIYSPCNVHAGALKAICSAAESFFSDEPSEVQKLRQMEIVKTDEGHQEYYFKQLTEEEQRVYREILNGIRNREEQFYLTLAADDSIDRTYHAVLKDHPEIFWVHNREKIYKTTYSDKNYCMFTPGYTYTENESVKSSSDDYAVKKSTKLP